MQQNNGRSDRQTAMADHAAARHLAHEWTLLQAADRDGSEPRVYIWDALSPAVVVGRTATIGEQVIVEACVRDAVPIVRRESGGGAVVLAPGCLNYAFALPFVSCPALADVRWSFRTILKALTDAMGIDGLDVAGGTDLALHGRKVSGNAQRRGRCAVLHHGTLLFGFDPELAERYLHEPARRPDYRGTRRHRDFVGNLPLTREALQFAVHRAFAAIVPGALVPAGLPHVGSRA